jgi:hypothetical protein
MRPAHAQRWIRRLRSWAKWRGEPRCLRARRLLGTEPDLGQRAVGTRRLLQWLRASSAGHSRSDSRAGRGPGWRREWRSRTPRRPQPAAPSGGMRGDTLHGDGARFVKYLNRGMLHDFRRSADDFRRVRSDTLVRKSCAGAPRALQGAASRESAQCVCGAIHAQAECGDRGEKHAGARHADRSVSASPTVRRATPPLHDGGGETTKYPTKACFITSLEATRTSAVSEVLLILRYPPRLPPRRSPADPDPSSSSSLQRTSSRPAEMMPGGLAPGARARSILSFDADPQLSLWGR